MILRGQQELGRKLRGMMMMPGEPERVEMKARARMTATGDRLEQRAATSKGQRVRAGTQRNLGPSGGRPRLQGSQPAAAGCDAQGVEHGDSGQGEAPRSSGKRVEGEPVETKDQWCWWCWWCLLRRSRLETLQHLLGVGPAAGEYARGVAVELTSAEEWGTRLNDRESCFRQG